MPEFEFTVDLPENMDDTIRDVVQRIVIDCFDILVLYSMTLPNGHKTRGIFTALDFLIAYTFYAATEGDLEKADAIVDKHAEHVKLAMRYKKGKESLH